MDAFFAAVELKRHPELKGKPLVIGGRGDPTQRGVVSTASYEARKFGIHSAMPLRTAHRLCPDAIFLAVDFEAYERESLKFKAALKEVTPIMEDVGIDEAFLDITELPESSETIACRIKTRVLEATGLTCSIGIAPNKLLAKIASDLDKPDGLTILTERDIRTRIWPLSARKLPGVGPKTEERLHGMGIETIGDVARTPLYTLVNRFGPAHGNHLYLAARGIDESPLVTHWEPKSSSREITFPYDISDRQLLLRTLRELTAEVADHIRSESYRCRTVAVKIRFADFKTHTKEKTLEHPTDQLQPIESAALNCFDHFILSKRVRLLGVRLGDLSKIDAG
jgi:DNA polymerase-4